MVTYGTKSAQPGIRKWCLSKPGQHDRQQSSLNIGPSAHTAAECFNVSQGSSRVKKTECTKSLCRGSAAESGRRCVKPGDSIEQGSVKQFLVDPAHLGTVTPPLTYQGINGVTRDAHAAGNNSQFIWILGHNVGAAQVTQLDSVFQRAQEAIRMFKLRSFLSTDVAPHGQCPKRINRVATPNQHIAATVDKLKELHRKLDVTQPTWTQFDFPVSN